MQASPAGSSEKLSALVSQADSSSTAAARSKGPARQQFTAMTGDSAMASTIDSHSQRQVCS